MTTAEAAKYLGTTTGVISGAGDRKLIPFRRNSRGAKVWCQADLDSYAAQRGWTVPERSSKASEPEPRRKPGAPTKAQRLAAIVLQMRDLAQQAEELAEDMLPAQLEYAFRLIWDKLGDDHRALMAAFVETQSAKGRRSA